MPSCDFCGVTADVVCRTEETADACQPKGAVYPGGRTRQEWTLIAAASFRSAEHIPSD